MPSAVPSQVVSRVLVEAPPAAGAAEEVRLARAGRAVRRLEAIDGHPADDVLGAAAQRQRDEPAGAEQEDDVEPGRVVPGDRAARDRVERGPVLGNQAGGAED